MGNESLAYRFFISESAWLGTPTFIWQGHLTSILQNIIFGFNQFIWGSANFRAELQNFALATLFLNTSLNTAIILFILFDKKLQAIDKLVIGLSLPMAIYGLRNYGMYYLLLPDYYAFNITLTTITIWLTFRILRQERSHSLLFNIACGIVMGLWLSNKASSAILLTPAFIMLIASASKKLEATIIIVLSCLATTYLNILFYYGLNFELTGNFFRAWLTLILGSSGEGASNLKAWFLTQIKGPYGVITGITLFWGGIASYYSFYPLQGRSRKICVVFGWIILIGFFLVLCKRPSGTTMFDAGLALVAVSCIWIGTIPNIYAKKYVGLFLVSTLALTGISIKSDFDPYIKTKIDANQEWQIYDEINKLADGKKVLVILLNNEYGHGGVHELLLKGTADFPSWNTSKRSEILIDRHAPGIRFKNEYVEPINLKGLQNDTVVVWYDRPDLNPISKRIDDLDSLTKNPSYICTIKTVGEKTIRTIANICVPK